MPKFTKEQLDTLSKLLSDPNSTEDLNSFVETLIAFPTSTQDAPVPLVKKPPKYTVAKEDTTPVSAETQKHMAESEARDHWFTQAWSRTTFPVVSPPVSANTDEPKFYNGKDRMNVKLKNGARAFVTPPKGMYHLPKVREVLERWRAESPDAEVVPVGEIATLIGATRVQERGIGANENSTGFTFHNSHGASEYLGGSSPFNWLIAGTPMTKSGDTLVLGGVLTPDEYLRYLATIHASRLRSNTWTNDIPHESLMGLQAKAQEMYDKLNKDFALIPGVSCYTVQARWLRYFSDGSMETQKAGLHGVRYAPRPSRGRAPLLYDGPSFVVGLEGKMSNGRQHILPLRVFITPDGQFICSDQCQREVDKGGGIDLITGVNTKHTLLTWVAGPALSRDDFLGCVAPKGTKVRRYVQGGASKGPRQWDVMWKIRRLMKEDRMLYLQGKELMPHEALHAVQAGGVVLITGATIDNIMFRYRIITKHTKKPTEYAYLWEYYNHMDEVLVEGGSRPLYATALGMVTQNDEVGLTGPLITKYTHYYALRERPETGITTKSFRAESSSGDVW